MKEVNVQNITTYYISVLSSSGTNFIHILFDSTRLAVVKILTP